MSEEKRESLYEKLVRCSQATDVPERLRFYQKPKLWESMGVVFRESYSGHEGKDVLLKVQPVLRDVCVEQSMRVVDEYQLMPEGLVCDGRLYEVSNKKERFRIENAFREVKVLDYLAQAGLGERYVQRLFCRDIGRDHELFLAGGDLYLRTLMEMKAGVCLGNTDVRYANEKEKEFGIMDPRDIVRCAADLAEDLLVLREHHIYHNDIKRANVLREIGARGESKFHIIDFGSARFYAELVDRFLVVGTEGYKAPEIMKGYGPNSYSDAWALGAMLYAEIGGRLPLQGHYKEVTFQDMARLRTALYRSQVPFRYEFLDVVLRLLSDEGRKRNLAELRKVSLRMLEKGEIYRSVSLESTTQRLQALNHPSEGNISSPSKADFRVTSALPSTKMKIEKGHKRIVDTFQEGEIDAAAVQAALNIKSEP